MIQQGSAYWLNKPLNNHRFDLLELASTQRAITNYVKILTNKETITDFDLVVCNADPPTVYSELIKNYKLYIPFKNPKKLLYSMGLFVIFFGTKRKYEIYYHVGKMFYN